jgi:spore germination cell wall hydrolase CwlJ-like protein
MPIFMIAQPYTNLSDLALLELCCWREARGEQFDGQRGVCHVIRNRSLVPSWWNGHIAGSLSRVILQKYQFSSFNPGDPNETKWPADDDPAFAECCAAAMPVYLGYDEDNTAGACWYYDTSIGWPKAWGDQNLYVQTLAVGRLLFWKKLAAPVIVIDLSASDL